MAKKNPSDLPTKWVRSPQGELVALKIVQSDSDTLEQDLLAAFRSNVRRVKRARRSRLNADVAA